MKKRAIALALVMSMVLFALSGCKKSDENSTADGTEGNTTENSQTDAVTPDGVHYNEENLLKVVSYNIRCVDDPDGNSIAERSERLEKVLGDYSADLIGFQEVVPQWEGLLETMLGGEYDYVLQYRAESNKEATPIFYRKDKFTLLDSGYFWLSTTPDKESKGWGSSYYRICSWVKLKVNATGSEFYYYNTHFDFYTPAQTGAAELIIEKAKEAGNAGVILTADFNMDETAAGYKTLTSYFTDNDAATANDPKGTYTDYGKESQHIDYCFVTENTVKPFAYKVMDDLVDGKYVSDHFGIYNEVIIL